MGTRSARDTRKRGGAQQSNQRGLLLILLALALLAFFLHGSVFVVKTITVTGVPDEVRQEVALLTEIKEGDSIFAVDEERIRALVSASSRFKVGEVKVVYPETVEIAVTERIPCAAIYSAGIVLVTDREGVILDRLQTQPASPHLVQVTGLEISVMPYSAAVIVNGYGYAQAMASVFETLEEMGTSEMYMQLSLANLDNIYLVSTNGVKVILGNSEEIEPKLVWAQAVLEQLIAQGGSGGTLDVSSGTRAVYSAN